jgi:hypothetical protein
MSLGEALLRLMRPVCSDSRQIETIRFLSVLFVTIDFNCLGLTDHRLSSFSPGHAQRSANSDRVGKMREVRSVEETFVAEKVNGATVHPRRPDLAM